MRTIKITYSKSNETKGGDKTLNVKALLGIVFVLIGGSILLGHGFLGGILSFLVACVLLYYGWLTVNKGDSKGKKVLGIIAIFFGIILIANAVPFLAGVAFAAFFIYVGWKMLTSQKETSSEEYHYSSPVVSDPVTKSSFDTEWEDFLKKDK